MTTDTWTSLQYTQVKEQLLGYAMSYLGREQIGRLSPSMDVRQIEAWLTETEEALGIVKLSGSVPIPTLTGIDAVMKAMGKGQVLTVQQIEQVEQFLVSTIQLQQYMGRKMDVAPRVASYALGLVLLEELLEEIRRSVRLGEIADEATETLASLRKQRRILDERLRRKVDAALQKYKSHLQEPFHRQIAGRYTLPVKRDDKRLVRGSVLDESASGQTVYIEPAEVADSQEELDSVQFAIEREESRILSMLTGWIEREQKALAANLEIIGHYDFLIAKAKLAKAMDARAVKVTQKGRINLFGARHPLLGQAARPIDFRIGQDFRTLIITGPNTGGKTVALKTVGLLTLMAQSGLLVPADKDSELSVFENILVDIGDGQSIDESLSTFSAHVKNLIRILDGAGARSLVLLDELASGTDPGEGIGLSIAILESLHNIGARVVATTHFNEIKRYAQAAPGFENARMEFDNETLQPLYRLKIGEAGDSYALIIAEKLGVPPAIVARARELAKGSAEPTGLSSRESFFGPEGLSGPADHAAPNAITPKLREMPTVQKDAGRGRDGDERGARFARGKQETPYQKGDRVWIHSLRTSGVFLGPADDKGNVHVLVRKERKTLNVKRIAPYLTRDQLYPDIASYDLDIVTETKDARRKRKIMAKRHVDGLSIDYPEQ